jgi:hypothetical protein
VALDGCLERVSAVLDKLGPGDIEILEPHLSAWIRRGRRLAQRDAAVRALVGDHYLHCGSGRGAAAAAAKDLGRSASSAWRFEQGKPPVGDAKRVLMHRILSLNGGKAIAADRIREILAGLR